jgi:DNA transposition AAA+ family ATPase
MPTLTEQAPATPITETPKAAPAVDNSEIITSVGAAYRASWPFSLDTIQQNISRYAPQAKQALIGAFLWCTDPLHPLPKPDFAGRVATSDNTLWKIFSGKYTHPETHQQLQPSEKLIHAIEQFLALEKKRWLMGETQLVITPTLKSITTLCDLARESQTVSFVVGPSHIGKTWALERHYTPNNNHGRTIFTRMEAASGLGGMVRAMAKSLSIADGGKITETRRRIKNALTPDMLWIFDEVHLLAKTYHPNTFHNCMEVIREIHDTCKVGMVLSFTELDEVKAANQKELQQLWRRAVHKLFLPSMPTIGDLTAILEHNGLKFPAKDLKVRVRYKDDEGQIQTLEDQPREIIRQVAKNEALKAITERIRYARKLAQKAGAPIDWSHFVLAHLKIAKQAEPPAEWN